MKIAATAFAILLAAPGLGSASIEGTWRVHDNPFASPSTVAFNQYLFSAHLGSDVAASRGRVENR